VPLAPWAALFFAEVAIWKALVAGIRPVLAARVWVYVRLLGARALTIGHIAWIIAARATVVAGAIVSAWAAIIERAVIAAWATIIERPVVAARTTIIKRAIILARATIIKRAIILAWATIIAGAIVGAWPTIIEWSIILARATIIAGAIVGAWPTIIERAVVAARATIIERAVVAARATIVAGAVVGARPTIIEWPVVAARATIIEWAIILARATIIAGAVVGARATIIEWAIILAWATIIAGAVVGAWPTIIERSIILAWATVVKRAVILTRTGIIKRAVILTRAGIILWAAILIRARIAARHRPITADCARAYGARRGLRRIAIANTGFQFGLGRAWAGGAAYAAGSRALAAAARRGSLRRFANCQCGFRAASWARIGCVDRSFGFTPADMCPERLDLLICQGAPFAGRQIAQHNRSLAHADQAQNLIAKLLGHLTDLALAAFVQHHTHPHAILAAIKHIDPSRRGGHTIHQHAAAPFSNRIGRGHLIEQRAIFFFDLIAGVRQPLGQLAVVGHQQQTFAIVIQPTNREEPLWQINQLDHGGPALRIVGGGHDAGRLIQHDIRARADLPNWPAVDNDLVLLGVDACARHKHNLAVHRHTAGADKLLAITPRGDAGTCQHLL
jgi:NDP-sugar pyrophosphorylase family protein